MFLFNFAAPAWLTDEGTRADFQCWAGALGQERTRGPLVSWEDNLFKVSSQDLERAVPASEVGSHQLIVLLQAFYLQGIRSLGKRTLKGNPLFDLPLERLEVCLRTH